MSDTSFGGFELGGMHLALPMAALREVLPFEKGRPLPSPTRCMIGGIDMRGVVIPVVDLRIVLGLPTPVIDLPCVIIMLHEGKVLGLLAEKVTGIFAAAPGGVHQVSVDDRIAAIFRGGVGRADNGQLVSLLAPAALAALPQVPMVNDPEPARQRVPEPGDAGEREEDSRSAPMLLVRCGRVPLAIEAMAVHATLSRPEVQPSVLARGHCKGVIAYAGMKVPAVDLLAMCGLGAIESGVETQAFVMLLPQGYVAFLVNDVLDVVRTGHGGLMQVPGFALPVKGLFAGAIAASALPAELTARSGMEANQFLVIDSQALRGMEAVEDLARANTPLVALRTGPQKSQGALPAREDAASHGTTEAGPGKALRDLITYDLLTETATPLAQIVEILPHSPGIKAFQGGQAMMGLLVHRGRSLPVFCLCTLTSAPEPAVNSESSVLIVDVDGERVGFSVPRLRSIEPSSWEPQLSHNGMAPGQSRAMKLAMVGGSRAGEGRMLPLLDLQALASDLLQDARALT